MKKALHILLIVALLLSMLTGCGSTSDLLDDYVGQMASGFEDYIQMTPELKDVMDMLDGMLSNYVSGLNKPSADNIPQTTLGSDDKNMFASVSNTCQTVEEMKALLLQTMTNTEKVVQFYALNSYYTNDVLYDVIFNQLCDSYMIETMGTQQYTVTTMATKDQKTAVQVEFSYFQDKYSLEQVKIMKEQTLAKAREVVRQLDLANLSVFERVQAVNGYLIDNCVYPDAKPYSCESHSPYGLLIEQSAVCEGYARAAQLLFELCDVPSYYVVGDTPSGGHAWNLVQIDGQWYQMDATWNDTDSKRNMYFLVTDEYMSLSRTWDRTKYPATATTPYQ